MSGTYYRKLEPGEKLQKDDFWPGRLGDVVIQSSWNIVQRGENYFRPIEISEAKPEPPAHRVEDETWQIYDNDFIFSGYKKVCCAPPLNAMGRDHWPQRAKRICAGQEALKFLERYQNEHCWPRVEEVDRILAMLKEAK